MLLLFLICVFLILLYRYTTRNHDYWAKRNVKHDRPIPFFGNHLPNFLVKRTVPDIGTELYNKYRGEKIVGYYRGTTPELIIRDPEIVKHVLSTDFKVFQARGGVENPSNEPLSNNLLFMSSEQWRVARQQLSPGFTRNKLRGMFPLVLQCVDQFQDILEEQIVQEMDIKAYDLIARYTLECLSSCCFGIKLDSIVSEHSKFIALAKGFFNKSKSQTMLMALGELLPEIGLVYTHISISKGLEEITFEITRRTREERRMKPSGRNDFIDIFLEIENQGKNPFLHSSGQSTDEETGLKFAAAHLFLFLVGGFESTATAISSTLHQLAHHPDIQSKIQEEIDTVLSKHENRLTFESLEEFEQLDMAFKESMRILSPFGSLRRECATRYTIPGTGVTIGPGVRILIPVQALHMDPEHFENPEEFCPERFVSQAVKERQRFTYMPFGEGPRKCIGSRIAHTIASAGLASILHKFTVEPASNSEYRQRVKTTSYLAQVVDSEYPLQFIPRSDTYARQQ